MGKESGCNVDDEFLFVESIGSGSYGEVFKCVNKRTGINVAIKTIDLEKAEDEIDDIQKEINILAQCDCKNITKYYCSKIVGVQLWIVMEYLGGGSTFDLMKLGTLDEVYTASIIREVLNGLAYLHAEMKIHRDIKSANILLAENGNVKIADFGVASQLMEGVQKRNTFVGTPYWMAPEVIKQCDYDTKADIWSLGITVYELSKGHPPFHNIHPMKALFSICKENPAELALPFSKHIRNFVSLCLNKDPVNRPDAKTLLKHKFIKTAKKTAILVDLIEKYKQWKLRNPSDKQLQIPVVNKSRESEGSDETPEWIFETMKITKNIMVGLNDDKSTKKENTPQNNILSKTRKSSIDELKSESSSSKITENKTSMNKTIASSNVLIPRNSSSIKTSLSIDDSSLKKEPLKLSKSFSPCHEAPNMTAKSSDAANILKVKHSKIGNESKHNKKEFSNKSDDTVKNYEDEKISNDLSFKLKSLHTYSKKETENKNKLVSRAGDNSDKKRQKSKLTKKADFSNEQKPKKQMTDQALHSGKKIVGFVKRTFRKKITSKKQIEEPRQKEFDSTLSDILNDFASQFPNVTDEIDNLKLLINKNKSEHAINIYTYLSNKITGCHSDVYKMSCSSDT